MKIAGLIEEDFVNYKLASMTVMFPYCTFKCNKECGQDVCQNSGLKDEELIEIDPSIIVDRYIANPITESIVMQGLEPFDSFEDLCLLISQFIRYSNDDIVIYTGYNKDEIIDKISYLKSIVTSNTLVVKFGRFIPNSNSRFDSILQVQLQSDNQYAEIVC